MDLETAAFTQYQKELNSVGNNSTYNPSQAEAEKHRVKSVYQILLKTLQEKKMELARPENDELLELVDESNDLLGMIKRTSTSALDSKFLLLSADIGAAKTGNMQKSALYTLDIFLERLGATVDLEVLGRETRRAAKSVDVPSFLFGPISIVKRQQQRKPRVRDVVEPELEAETLSKEALEKSANYGNETTQAVISVYGNLVECGPVKYLQFVCNPESFSNSVENVFYVSFLVRDGRALLYLQDCELFIKAVESDADLIELQNANKNHLIMDFDYEVWKQTVSKNQLRKPFIPTRK